MKRRANRYIAAAKKEWLYPEKELPDVNWEKLDDVLISDKFLSKGYPGEIFIGGKNGKLIAMQDEFGRKPKTQEEWEAKEKQAFEMEAHVHRLLEKERDKKANEQGDNL